MAKTTEIPRRLIIAVGGNALQAAGTKGTSVEQMDVAAATAHALLPILQLDNELLITHGNGPAVGKLLLRNAFARDRVVPMSLDILVADTQGATGYILAQAFENALRETGNQRAAVGLVSQVEVDPNDPGFQNPTKPIGYFFSEADAKALMAECGWKMKEDAGRGWRVVVASPQPKHICDISLVDAVMRQGSIVISGGGGGIPVVRDSIGRRHGVEAVIDKDLTSAKMANILGIDTMMILTAVPRVAINFGKPSQQELDRVSISEIRKHHAEGQFPAGSMGPKVEAAIKFIEGGGKRAIIASLEDALPALRGETGTHIVPDDEV